MGYPRHTYRVNAWQLLWDWFRERKKRGMGKQDREKLGAYEASGLRPEAVQGLAQSLLMTQMALEDVLKCWNGSGSVCDTCWVKADAERCLANDSNCKECQEENCLCKYCDGTSCWTWRGPEGAADGNL